MNAGLTEALWYLGRGAGVVSLLMLTVTVVLGVGSRRGAPAFGLPRFAVTVVHRGAGLLSVAFLTVHVVSLLFDPYAQLRLVDLVVPFAGTYRPLWLGLGTLALDLLVAVVVTSLLRRRIGVRAWRVVHWAAYALWPVALAHGLGTGTDATSVWMLVLVALSVAGFLGALGWRVGAERGRDAEGRLPGGGVPPSGSSAVDRASRTRVPA